MISKPARHHDRSMTDQVSPKPRRPPGRSMAMNVDIAKNGRDAAGACTSAGFDITLMDVPHALMTASTVPGDQKIKPQPHRHDDRFKEPIWSGRSARREGPLHQAVSASTIC